MREIKHGDPRIRAAFERLRDLAVANPGEWSTIKVPVGEAEWMVGWQATKEGTVYRHRIALQPVTWPVCDAQAEELLLALPRTFGALSYADRAEKRVRVIVLGQVRELCSACGERMDTVARCALAEKCSVCSFAAGELEIAGVPVDPAVTQRIIDRITARALQMVRS